MSSPGPEVTVPTFTAIAHRYAPPPLTPTPHPRWVESFLDATRRDWDAACWPPLFRDTADGLCPPLASWRRVLSQFFLIVESFPKYMGLSLAKTTYGQSPGDASIRRWLLQNLGVESKHAEWYIDWVRAIGVSTESLFGLRPLPAIQALHAHLLDTCTRGSLAEGVAATNWAIESITGVWTREVMDPFRAYSAEGARIDAASMMWLKAHARYDDLHPVEALEIIKLATDPRGDEPVRVLAATRKSLRLYTTAIRACCSD